MKAFDIPAVSARDFASADAERLAQLLQSMETLKKWPVQSRSENAYEMLLIIINSHYKM